MSVEEIESAIRKLPPEELLQVHRLVAELASDQWDRQIEADVEAGKFDKIRERVIAHEQAGLLTDLHDPQSGS
jgi:hypothetical protein